MKALIVSEIVDGKLSSGSLEIVSKAEELGLEYQLITLGSEEQPIIGSSSFKQTYLKRSPNSLQYNKIADYISNVIKNEQINLVFGSSTYQCRDIIAYLSVDLNSSPVSNVINFSLENDKVITLNSINGGQQLYKTEIDSSISFLLIRPKSFEPANLELNTDFTTIEIESGNCNVYEIHKEEKAGPQLEDSKVVVSAGRGMVDVANLELINKLSKKLNAAIGGTRAIVDAGWMPYSQQVGQTGKTVKPDVYIACGISGATQHQVGMKDSKFIIAINKDEEAPIFQIADLGIVGDTLTVLPKLIENI